MISLQTLVLGFLLTPAPWIFSIAAALWGLHSGRVIVAGLAMFILWTIYRFVFLGSLVATYFIVGTPIAGALCYIVSLGLIIGLQRIFLN